MVDYFLCEAGHALDLSHIVTEKLKEHPTFPWRLHGSPVVTCGVSTHNGQPYWYYAQALVRDHIGGAS